MEAWNCYSRRKVYYSHEYSQPARPKEERNEDLKSWEKILLFSKRILPEFQGLGLPDRRA